MCMRNGIFLVMFSKKCQNQRKEYKLLENYKKVLPQHSLITMKSICKALSSLC